jgi:hypothetical protein
MSVIRKLGDRVEKEHAQFLRDSQRLSSSTTTTTTTATSGTVDFESLVAGTGVGGAKVEDAGWEDDVWGSIFTQVGFCVVCVEAASHLVSCSSRRVRKARPFSLLLLRSRPSLSLPRRNYPPPISTHTRDQLPDLPARPYCSPDQPMRQQRHNPSLRLRCNRHYSPLIRVVRDSRLRRRCQDRITTSR